jgi:hypothetical protein
MGSISSCATTGTGRCRSKLAGTQQPTHLGLVLQDLGIGYIQARSPQAKGRIERLWATLQDRLVSELRQRSIATRAAANTYLPQFLADFNRRFARAPASAQSVWRRPPSHLALALSCRYDRVVGRDNTVRLGPRLIQIPRGPRGRSYARRRVEVRELLDGRAVVFLDSAVLATAPAPQVEFTLPPRTAPSAARRRRSPRRRVTVRTALTDLADALPPAKRRHPWRLGYDPSRALAAGYLRHYRA